jgi:hypothetical protein
VYTGINFGASKYASIAFEMNYPVFTAEIGNPFYLKLNLIANPLPTGNLRKNGIALPLGTVDSVYIQSVQATDAGNYTISCSNLWGEGQFFFRLKVVGKILFLSIWLT